MLTVYVDILIFENFIINYFLMTITSQSIRHRPKKWCSALAAFIGSLYVLVLLFNGLGIFKTVPFKILVAILLVIITFGIKDIILTIKASIIFLLYSMMLAGFCVFLQFNSVGYMLNTLVIYNFSYKKLILALMALYMVLYKTVIYLKDRKEIHELIYDVYIYIGNSKKKVRAFLDTGNELREPATSLPVFIVESRVFSGIDINSLDRFYIPYKSISGEYEKIIGIKPTCIEINTSKTVEKREVIIGICNSTLSSAGDYDALLSRGII